MTIGTIQGGNAQLFAHQVALAAARTAETQAEQALAEATAVAQTMLPPSAGIRA